MSTAESRRKRIVAFVLARLALITIAGGYRTDASQLIEVGFVPDIGAEAEVGDVSSALAVVVGEDAVQSNTLKASVTLPITIHALARGTRAAAWMTVEDVLADIKEVVEVDDWTLGGLVNVRLEKGSTRTMVREAGSLMVGAEIEYLATYPESWGAPGA